MRRKKPVYLSDLSIRIDTIANLRWQLQLTVVNNFVFSTSRENPAAIFNSVNILTNEIEYSTAYALSRKLG